MRQRAAIGIARVEREVRVRVAQRQDARAERDVLAHEAPGKALTIEALVHGRHRARGARGQPDALQQSHRRLCELFCGGAMRGVLGRVESGQVIRDGLADVVQVRRNRQLDLRHLVEVQSLREHAAETRHRRGVTTELVAGVLVERNEHVEHLGQIQQAAVGPAPRRRRRDHDGSRHRRDRWRHAGRARRRRRTRSRRAAASADALA